MPPARRAYSGIVRSGGPERLLVELNPLLFGTSHDHGAKSAIADRKRFRPLLRRLAIPQFQFGRIRSRYLGHAGESGLRGQQARRTREQSLAGVAT